MRLIHYSDVFSSENRSDRHCEHFELPGLINLQKKKNIIAFKLAKLICYYFLILVTTAGENKHSKIGNPNLIKQK